MKIIDNGVVLAVTKLNEKSVLAQVFTQSQGLYCGYVAITKQNRSWLQVGNIIKINWNARLANHLGHIYCELIEAFSGFILDNYKKTLAISSALKTLTKVLPQRDAKPEIYNAVYKFLYSLKYNKDWAFYYLKLELIVLKNLGYQLDLTSCPVTNSSHDLKFISPKTGRAISHSAGLPYQDKLFKLPPALKAVNENISDASHTEEQFADCLQVTNYFIHKHCFQPCNIKLPIERELLYKVFVKS